MMKSATNIVELLDAYDKSTAELYVGLKQQLQVRRHRIFVSTLQASLPMARSKISTTLNARSPHSRMKLNRSRDSRGADRRNRETRHRRRIA